MKNILNHLRTDWYKYVLELIVITAGILGAYSLNNWNEDRKSIQKGREILKDVRDNVASNIIQFQKDIEDNEKVIESIDIIIENIAITRVYDTSIDKHLRFATWWATSRWKSSGYEALVNHGVDIIQSKPLRETIIDLHEISYPEIIENTRLTEGNWNVMFPHWIELIYRDPSDFTAADQHKAKPFDYQEMVDSRLFLSFLTFNRSQRLVDIKLREKAIQKNLELLVLIDQELE